VNSPLDSATTLADLTTLHVGGPVGKFVLAQSEDEFIDAIAQADATNTPLLVIGDGSNLLAADEGFPGVVVKDGRTGFVGEPDESCGIVSVTVVAGQNWDELVAEAIDQSWSGIEAMSGIPGTAGAAPVQNIGAYGQEIGSVISSVRVWDRLRNRVRVFAAQELDLSYRNSRLKDSMFAEPSAADPKAPWWPTPRYVVLEVTLQLRMGRLSAPIVWPELAERLGINLNERAPSKAVRKAVLALRSKKGVLVDGFCGSEGKAGARELGDHDRWSAGSFFTNPVLSSQQAEALPPEVPIFAVTAGAEIKPGDDVKTSAAWLIENSGFAKGFGVSPDARATLSNKHTLVLTNRGEASADDILTLARTIRAGVEDKYGIRLEPEPVFVGLKL